MHSNAGAVAKIYLDFDGYSAMTWGSYSVTTTPAYSIDTDPNSFSTTELANIQEIWQRVSEKYSPFNVDVTTQDPGNTNNLQTVVAVIGGGGGWLGSLAGGVAYVGSFSNSAPNQAWIFPDNLGAGFPKYVGEATAHEVGHAFGLYHQSLYSGTTLVQDYYSGDAYRAPTMGNSYSSARGMWWYGTSTSSTTFQDDLAVIAGSANGFGYKADDVGDTTSAAGTLTGTNGNISASGIIGNTGDADYYILDIPADGTMSINLNGPNGAMLDAKLELRYSDGSFWFSNDSTPGTTEFMGGSIAAGRYYLVVRSHGGYGDIGKYTISGTIPIASLPNAPSGLTATTISTSQINLSWTDNSSNEAGFRIERSPDGVTWSDIASVGANIASYSNTGLSAGTTYYYRVSSYISWGAFSPSNISSATTVALWQDGQLDTTFGSGGIVVSDWGAQESGWVVLIQPDQKVLVGGCSGDGTGSASDFLLARYSDNGVLDATFGTGGRVITDLGRADYLSAMALQPDGRIIAGGRSGTGATGKKFLVRYNSNGSLDTSFGNAGTVEVLFLSSGDTLSNLLVQPDGKIVAVGTADSSHPKFGVARYNANGTLDTTFGTNGVTVTDVQANSYDMTRDAVLQPDGKIIVVGRSYALATGIEGFAVVRYTSGGLLDTTFGGGDGMLNTSFPPGSAVAKCVRLQGNKIIVGGLANRHFTFVRYNSDGSVDTTFGSAGTSIIPETDYYDSSSKFGMGVDADGRIVFAGPTDLDPSPSVSRTALTAVRLNSNGAVDTSFGTAGIVSTSVGLLDVSMARDLAFTSDGKIVLTGDSFSGGINLTLVRYTAHTVTNANQAPTDIALSAGSIAENQASGAAVGTFSTTDPDAGNTFTYSLVSGTGGTDNASFTISGSTLQTAASFNYEAKNSYSIRVRTTDQGGLWFEKAFTVTVTNVNEAPTDIALSASTVAENQPSGTTVGTFSTTDPDAGNTFTYSLVTGTGSTDNASFTISGSTLQTAASFDYDTKSSYSIRLRTTDQGGLWIEKVFAIDVTNINEAPTDTTLSPSSVLENQAIGAIVGMFSTVDPDVGDTFTYVLVNGTGGQDNGSFTISGNMLQTAAVFNYAAKSSYSIRVRTTDAGGLYFGKIFAVTVTFLPPNSAPTNISLSTGSVAENQPVDTAVGTFSSTDPDAGNTFTYSLVSGMGSTDNTSFAISGSALQTAASFDFEAKSSYSIRVRSTDQGGLWFEQVFAINVTDVDEVAPTVTAIYVRGSSWASGYLSFLAANMGGSSATYGYAIPVGSGTAQLQTLPWRNLNQISLAFSEEVSVSQAQFAIVGSVGSYSVSGFSYSSADRVATWSLSAAIGPDKLYVALPGSGATPVTDAAANSLDGEWTNPSSYTDAGSTSSFPSGNGTAGGDFAFRFDVLPGDSTGGSLGKVNVADVAQSKSRSTLAVSSSSYRSDFDGNNLINVADVAYVKSKSSIYSLPVDPPVLPVFGPVFSQVSVLLRDRYGAAVW